MSAVEEAQAVLTAPYRRGLERAALAVGDVNPEGWIDVDSYDFDRYVGLYGHPPDAPRYLLVPLFEVTERLEVDVRFVRAAGAAGETATLTLEPGAFARLAHAIPIPEPWTPELRITALRPRPDPPPGTPQANWELVALLGELAKLLWAAGWSGDELGHHLADVRAQRRLAGSARAHGASLDLHGRDLGVPRLPPAAASFDADTLALYHLDDVPGPGESEVAAAMDERRRHQPGSDHPATNHGARSGRPGRFGTAFELTAAGVGSFLEIADHADFALPAARSFTVDVILRPRSRADGHGAVVAKRATLNAAAVPGWELSAGRLRGIDGNVRFSVSDGHTEAVLFADVGLVDGTFHHVAGTVERRAAGALVRLLVDGRERARARLDALGALDNAEPIRIGLGREDATGGGPIDTQYVGLVDEVRLSSRARTSFHPLIGEGDEEYRRRLAIYREWHIATPGQLAAAINRLVSIDGQTESFVLLEDDNAFALRTSPLRIIPRAVRRGAAIAADGNLRADEAAVVGTPEQEPEFDPAWLVRHDDARAHYAGSGARLMQRGVADALNALLDRAGPTLSVLRAYDADADDLHRVGRALELSHDALAADRLAAHAHAAGFDFVRHAVTGFVGVAQARREALSIDSTVVGTPPPAGVNVEEGAELTLQVTPRLPVDAEVRWVLIPCGEGGARLVTPGGTESMFAVGPQARVRARTAGAVTIRVEAAIRDASARGTRTLRVGPPASGPGAVAPGQAISASGRRGVPEAAATGEPSAAFMPAYLVYHDEPGADYGSDRLNHRMQRVTAAALDRLLALTRAAGTLEILGAYALAAGGLQAQGRALVLSHAALDPSALAALAFAAGFDYMRPDAGQLYVSCAPGDLITITGGPEVETDAEVELAIDPQARPAAVACTPDGAVVLVADAGSHLVTAVGLDGPSNRLPDASVIASVPVGRDPAALATAAGQAYVANAGDASVCVLSMAPSLDVITTFATGVEPRGIALLPDASAVYVACAGDNRVRVHDASGGSLASVAVSARPVAIAMQADGTRAWVATEAGRELVVISTGVAPAAGGAIPLPGTPSALALAPDGATAYVALRDSGEVAVVDLAAGTIAMTISLAAADPRALALNADGSLLWVACTAAGEVRVIDTATSTLDPSTISLAREPVALAASPGTAPYAPAVVAASAAGSDLTLLDPVALGPGASPSAATLLLGAGDGERVSWAVIALAGAALELSSSVTPTVSARGVAPGQVLARALYVRSVRTNPYECELRLTPGLDGAGTVVRKDQYDIVMNVLSTLGPIGVEIRTRGVREHVVEVREGLLDAFPAYTYPQFRPAAADLFGGEPEEDR